MSAKKQTKPARAPLPIAPRADALTITCEDPHEHKLLAEAQRLLRLEVVHNQTYSKDPFHTARVLREMLSCSGLTMPDIVEIVAEANEAYELFVAEVEAFQQTYGERLTFLAKDKELQAKEAAAAKSKGKKEAA